MAKFLLLGCGLVGKTIAKNLAKSNEVSVIDVRKENFEALRNFPSIKCIEGDVLDKLFISSIVSDFDLVVSAVPGSFGFQALKNLIELRKNVVDIAFFPENPFELDDLAKFNGVSCVVDCGIAPGLSNMIIGYHSFVEKFSSATIYVGGLPYERTLPFEYKAPFSPSDVLEEYIRTARYKQNGEIAYSEPLTEIEHINFKGIGTLEAFLTDGLRTLLFTTDIPNLREKTLRYPGYAEKILFLKECGFLSTRPVKTKDGKVVPLNLTSELLLPKWKLSSDDDEFTAMKVELVSSDRKKSLTYEIFDRTDKANGDSSMGRTTGFVACAVANLFANGKIEQKGIIPPEILARDKSLFEFVLNYLKQRNVLINVKETTYG